MTEEFRFRDLQQAWGVGRTFEVSLNDLYREREFESASEFPALPAWANLEAALST